MEWVPSYCVAIGYAVVGAWMMYTCKEMLKTNKEVANIAEEYMFDTKNMVGESHDQGEADGYDVEHLMYTVSSRIEILVEELARKHQLDLHRMEARYKKKVTGV